MVDYKGKLYAGTDANAATFGTVLVREPSTGVWTTAYTGNVGTAKIQNGCYSLREFKGNLYAGFWNQDTPAESYIVKFDNTSWSVPSSSYLLTTLPYIGMFEDKGYLYAIGGKSGLAAALIRSVDGTTWTDLTGFLSTDASATSVFGIIIL